MRAKPPKKRKTTGPAMFVCEARIDSSISADLLLSVLASD
jgi:hypothetical protein